MLAVKGAVKLIVRTLEINIKITSLYYFLFLRQSHASYSIYLFLLVKMAHIGQSIHYFGY